MPHDQSCKTFSTRVNDYRIVRPDVQPLQPKSPDYLKIRGLLFRELYEAEEKNESERHEKVRRGKMHWKTRRATRRDAQARWWTRSWDY